MPNSLTIVGLGPGSFGALSLEGYRALQKADKLFLRTERHPLVKDLKDRGIKYFSFDYIYDSSLNFDQVYANIAQQVVDACEDCNVVYAVPGHPWVGESTVGLIVELAAAKGITVQFTSSVSFLDDLFTVLQIDPCAGIKIIDALQLSKHDPSPDTANLIMQVYNRLVAGDVKLKLMEFYPEDFPIQIVRAAGVKGEERKETIPLYELDRLDWIDHLTTVFIPPYPEGRKVFKYPLDPLVDVMSQLRGENGCPWDKEQTHQSLIPYILEEAYEVIEAIEEGDTEHLVEELGDLLLQVIFHAQLGWEDKKFDINDVIDIIVQKMIRRHPHVFGQVNVDNTEQVLKNWNAIKEKEQKQKGQNKPVSYLKDLPKQMPALMRAYKIQAKAAEVGFDWEEIEQVWAKVEEEIEELKSACKKGKAEDIDGEVGDLIFAVVNLARFLNIQPEVALDRTIKKFRNRFSYIEQKAEELGKNLKDLSLAEMDKLWEEAKYSQKNNEKAGNI